MMAVEGGLGQTEEPQFFKTVNVASESGYCESHAAVLEPINREAVTNQRTPPQANMADCGGSRVGGASEDMCAYVAARQPGLCTRIDLGVAPFLACSRVVGASAPDIKC